MELNSKETSWMPISHLYQTTLERLIDGNCSLEEEENILSELKKLQQIKDQLYSISPDRQQFFYEKFVEVFRSGSCPMLPMALSFISYNLTLMGLDTLELQVLMNSNQLLINEIISNSNHT